MLNVEDLHISTYRGRYNSKGGWSIETELGVKVVHLPTGYVVNCDDFKSQHKNKIICMRALRELLVEQEEV